MTTNTTPIWKRKNVVLPALFVLLAAVILVLALIFGNGSGTEGPTSTVPDTSTTGLQTPDPGHDR
ncbi:hypothetical protein GIS00_11930 [Nakamurella sp. YIM 132087]|uniref:Uncharacterized protein n=1 Tax=Nakamurella alba TaxID=2665158 RepID=A0A7K1FKI5_9ACTN|nr:hypothetical protein [Nakamurella alba]MTD14652.1 hypothetical protein [Nakamurella alba]